MVRSGCQSVALACTAMGTRFELLLRGRDAAVLRAAGEAALDEVQRWHGLLSAFDRASVVSRINAGAGSGVPVRCPPEVMRLLCLCQSVREATGGAFDPAVGEMMRLGGFRSEERDERSLGTAAGRARTGGLVIDAEGSRVMLPLAGVALDLGAIGKGWALDCAAEVLRESGVNSGLLHGGTSSVLAIGRDAVTGSPWRVVLGADEGGLTLELQDAALGLSAPSGRTSQQRDGTTHGHVLDPRTGVSARRLCGAAVVGASAAVCDAWSTALLVEPGLARSERWPAGYRGFTEEPGGGWRVCSELSVSACPACAGSACAAMEGSVC